MSAVPVTFALGQAVTARLTAILAAVLAALVLGAFPQVSGAQAQIADGDLLQVHGDDKIHLIEGGHRRWIADTTSLRRLSPDYGRLKRITFAELDAIPPGRPFRQFPVIRDEASGRIYLVTQEAEAHSPRKHWINDLESFTRLGFRWSDVELSAPVAPDQLPDAPSLSYRPVPKDQQSWVHDGVALRSIPAWRLQVEDERLYLALALANTYNPDWREQVAPKLLQQGMWIEWRDLPASVSGQYDVHLNRISLSRALQRESDGVIASVLSHEAYHAVSPRGRDAVSCFEEEIEAFGMGAITWANLPAKWRSQGDWGRALDALIQAWQSGALRQLVLAEASYQLQCGR
jgi:hypothetical protein